jgi:hypothetical protein
VRRLRPARGSQPAPARLVRSGQAHPLPALRHLRRADFSERANTPLFGLRTSEETLVAIARHLAEGVGCRATARLTGVTLNTVLRFTQRFGRHAELFHDSKVRGIQPEQIQADEAWSFVGKKTSAATRSTQTTPSKAATGTTSSSTPNPS